MVASRRKSRSSTTYPLEKTVSDTRCTRCERNATVPGSAICRECLEFRCTLCTRVDPHGHATELQAFNAYDRFLLDHPDWPILF